MEDCNSDFEVTSCNLEVTSSDSEVTSSVNSLHFPQHFFTLASTSLQLPAMALVTVVTTERNLSVGTGKFHANWGCLGLQSRKTPLREVTLGAATKRGLEACNYCQATLYSAGYTSPGGTPPPDSRLFTPAPTATSATGATSGTSATTAPSATSEATETACYRGLEAFLNLGTTCKLEKDFNSKVKPLTDENGQSTFLERLSFECNCLGEDYLWIALPRTSWRAHELAGTLTEEFKERGNETLCTTPWGAVRYFYFRLDCFSENGTSTLTAGDKATRPILIGLRLDCKNFVKDWMSGDFNFSRFNRWYADYFVTHYGPMKLTANTLQAAVELEVPFTYLAWKEMTSQYFTFKQLVWDGMTPVPYWLSAAQGHFGDTATSAATTPAEDSDENSKTVKKTAKASTSSSSSSLVEQALAKALLVLTEKKH